MDNKSLLRRERHLLTIKMDESLSTMVILLRPDYSFDLLFLLAVVLFGLTLYFISSSATTDSSDPYNSFISGLIIFIPFSIVFHSVYTKRSVKCVIKRNSGIIQYERGGFLGTPLFTKNFDFPFAEIEGFEVKTFIRGRGPRFQILAVFKTGERLELLGKELGITESQTAVTEIRNFINPQLPIKEIWRRGFAFFRW